MEGEEEGHGRARGQGALARDRGRVRRGRRRPVPEEKAKDPEDVETVPGLGDDAFIEDLGLDLHVLAGERVLSVEMHNYRYPEPLTKEQIQQKEQDAAQIVLGRLT